MQQNTEHKPVMIVHSKMMEQAGGQDEANYVTIHNKLTPGVITRRNF